MLEIQDNFYLQKAHSTRRGDKRVKINMGFLITSSRNQFIWGTEIKHIQSISQNYWEGWRTKLSKCADMKEASKQEIKPKSVTRSTWAQKMPQWAYYHFSFWKLHILLLQPYPLQCLRLFISSRKKHPIRVMNFGPISYMQTGKIYLSFLAFVVVGLAFHQDSYYIRGNSSNTGRAFKFWEAPPPKR